MYYCFVSESGKPSFHENQDYVISNLIIKKNTIDQLQVNFNEFIKKINEDYEFEGEPLIIKANDILRGKGIYGSRHFDDRIELIKQIIEFIAQSDIIIMSVILDKQTVWGKGRTKKQLGPWAEKWVWKIFFEKSTHFLKLYSEATGGEYIFNGINDQANSAKLNKLNAILAEDQAESGNKFIEGGMIKKLSFQNKKESSFLQISDVIGWVIRRYYNTVIPEKVQDKIAHELYEKLTPKFALNEKGSAFGFGMKIFPNILSDNSNKKIEPSPNFLFDPVLMEQVVPIKDKIIYLQNDNDSS